MGDGTDGGGTETSTTTHTGDGADGGGTATSTTTHMGDGADGGGTATSTTTPTATLTAVQESVWVSGQVSVGFAEDVGPCSKNVTAALRRGIAAAATNATGTKYSEEDVKELTVEGCIGTLPVGLEQVRTISYELYVPDPLEASILKTSVETTGGGAAAF